MKQRIALKETDLHRMIKESVRQILNENTSTVNWGDYLLPLSEAGSKLKEVYTDFKELYNAKVLPAEVIDNVFEASMLIGNAWNYVLRMHQEQN